MAFYQFKRTQEITGSLSEVWDFISTPVNLKEITPDYMGFQIISEGLPDKMYAGMMIRYKVNLLPGISSSWVTEITQVKEHSYFVDEQRIGPYKMWHHQHFIEPTPHGVQMTDIVSYEPPLGILGRLANKLLIDSELKKIFNFRTMAIERQFKNDKGDRVN